MKLLGFRVQGGDSEALNPKPYTLGQKAPEVLNTGMPVV